MRRVRRVQRRASRHLRANAARRSRDASFTISRLLATARHHAWRPPRAVDWLARRLVWRHGVPIEVGGADGEAFLSEDWSTSLRDPGTLRGIGHAAARRDSGRHDDVHAVVVLRGEQYRGTAIFVETVVAELWKITPSSLRPARWRAAAPSTTSTWCGPSRRRSCTARYRCRTGWCEHARRALAAYRCSLRASDTSRSRRPAAATLTAAAAHRVRCAWRHGRRAAGARPLAAPCDPPRAHATGAAPRSRRRRRRGRDPPARRRRCTRLQTTQRSRRRPTAAGGGGTLCWRCGRGEPGSRSSVSSWRAAASRRRPRRMPHGRDRRRRGARRSSRWRRVASLCDQRDARRRPDERAGGWTTPAAVQARDGRQRAAPHCRDRDGALGARTSRRATSRRATR